MGRRAWNGASVRRLAGQSRRRTGFRIALCCRRFFCSANWRRRASAEWGIGWRGRDGSAARRRRKRCFDRKGLLIGRVFREFRHCGREFGGGQRLFSKARASAFRLMAVRGLLLSLVDHLAQFANGAQKVVFGCVPRLGTEIIDDLVMLSDAASLRVVPGDAFGFDELIFLWCLNPDAADAGRIVIDLDFEVALGRQADRGEFRCPVIGRE